MMADDSILRVLHGKPRQQVMVALEDWVATMLEQVRVSGGFEQEVQAVTGWWLDLRASVKEASRRRPI